MDTNIALLIQLTGVILIAILTVCLQRSLKSVALKYWTYAWLSLSLGLIFLRLAFEYGSQANSLFSLYFFGEYLFGFMLVTGCRSLYPDDTAEKMSELLIVPLGVIAIGLPIYSKNFDEMYSVHCVLLAGFFASAFISLGKATVRSFGWRVMNVAVGLLAIDYVVFFSVFTADRYLLEVPMQLIQFNSIIDLVLETALGFGMVIILLERVVSDANETNVALADAHQRLEVLVNTDPLTAAFNRHAFYGFVGRGGGDSENVSGCVGFFDIDNLKEINDQFGHTAGDQAIRNVAHAIRSVIRAEDLIYRWGGDEFFVIMVGMNAEMAAVRMERIGEVLTDLVLDDSIETVAVGVSSGFSDFKGSTELEHAIKKADSNMYEKKAMRKELREPSGYAHAFLPRLTA